MAKPHVLIVDGEPEARRLIRQSLESEGVTVIEAARGDVALELAKRLLPELILVDSGLPGMTGAEVVQRLKAEVITSHLPILYMMIEPASLPPLGGVETIPKHLAHGEVLDKVRELLALPSRSSQRRRRILIADDEPDIVDILATQLTAQGYETLAAHDGFTALQFARHEKPDLVILDLHLPKLDGFQVMKMLKADQEVGLIPIIVLTGVYLTDQDKQTGLRLGAVRYFTKPYEATALLKEIAQVLGGTRRGPTT
ncbi:MAG: response regulator [Candidatus Omnitrophica bacterium]|nr:response regulator [Candidatus Omnitrophota bacterium]